MDTTYTCTNCAKVGTIDSFFTYKLKDGTIKPLPKCRKCHNLGQYTKKPTGFSKLDAEQQERIRQRLVDRRVKIKDVAHEEGILYESLRRWVQNGLLIN